MRFPYQPEASARAGLHAQAEYESTKSQSKRLARVGVRVLDQENVEEARLGFEAAKAGLAKAKADEGVAERRLEVARKASDYAQTILKYTKILAPFDGVVTQRNINERDFVQPVAGRKGEALFVVEQVDPVRVFIDVPEVEAVWLREGATASVRCQSLPGQEFRGSVTRTSWNLNPATHATHRDRPAESRGAAAARTVRRCHDYRGTSERLDPTRIDGSDEGGRDFLLPAGER